MKYLSFMFFLSMLMTAQAQLSVDLEVGSSKADYGFSALRMTYQINTSWQVGFETQNGYYRYRFIDARQVEGGWVSTNKLLVVGRIAENELLRFDAFLKPGLRIMTPPDDEFTNFNNYDFNATLGLSLEPGLLVTIKASDRFHLHSGVNLNMAFQFNPTFVFEQWNASYLLAGASYALGEHWAVYGQAMAGPTSGANGDTEKFLWQLKAGLRYTLGKTTEQANLILGY